MKLDGRRGPHRCRRFVKLLIAFAVICPAVLTNGSFSEVAAAAVCDPIDGTPFTTCDLDGYPGHPSTWPPDDPLNPCDDRGTSTSRRNNSKTVVQYADHATGERFTPICLLEQIVVRQLVAERGVPFDSEQRNEVLTHGRDEIRARLYTRLLLIQEAFDKGGDTRAGLNAIELESLAWANARNRATQVAIAEAAVAEYQAWKEAPCTYEPPEPYEYDTTTQANCTGGLVGLFTNVTPPSSQDFTEYGYARYTGTLSDDVARTSAAASASVIGFALGSSIGGVAAGAAVTTLIVTAKISGLIFLAKATPALGPLAIPIVIVAALIAATIARGVQVFQQSQIEPQLESEALLAEILGGPLTDESFMISFADATAPRFDPSPGVGSARPDPGSQDAFLTTTQEGSSTIAHTIRFNSDNVIHRAWISDGWWVVEPNGDPSQRTLVPRLLIHADNGQLMQSIAVVDGEFVETFFLGPEPTVTSSTQVEVEAPRRTDLDGLGGVPAIISFTEPELTATPSNVTVDEGQMATFSGTALGANAVSIDFGIGEDPTIVLPSDADGSFSVTRQFDDDVESTVTTTPIGTFGAGTPATSTLVVENVAPTITTFATTGPAGGSGPFAAGDTIEVELVFSDPGSGDTHEVLVDWGDGDPVASLGTATTVQHVFASPGVFAVKASVEDDDGALVTSTIDVSVLARPVLANVVFPSGDEGEPLTIVGRVTGTAAAGASVRVGASGPTVAVAADGSFTVDATRPDDGVFSYVLTPLGASGEAGTPVSGDVTVANVSPTVDSLDVEDVVGTSNVVIAGEHFAFGVGFTDPGSADTHTVSVDWGDRWSEVSLTGATSFSHTFGAAGVNTITVIVRDDDGGEGRNSVDVQVIERPVLAGVVFPTGGEGDTVAVTGRVTLADPTASVVRIGEPGGPTEEVALDPSDGSFSFELTRADDETVTLELTPVGEFGQAGTASVGDVVFTNVAPTVTGVSIVDRLGRAGPFGAGTPVFAEVDFTDPGVADTHTVTVDWGDGPTSSGSSTDRFSHVYADETTTSSVLVSVTDDDGGVDDHEVVVEFDLVGPSVVSVDSVDGVTATNSPVDFTVTFDEAVVGFEPSDVLVSGLGGTVVVVETPDPSVFIVTVTPATDGSFAISVDPSGTTDLVGNPGLAVAPAPMSPTVLYIAGDPDPGINNAPSVVAPTSMEVEAGGSANVALVVTDPDLLDGRIDVTITTTGGTLAASGDTVVGSGTATIVISGRIDEVGAALATLVHSVDGVGVHEITVSADDNGNTGPAAAGITAVSIAVTVSDSIAPTIVVPGTIVANTDPGEPTALVDYTISATDPGSVPATANGSMPAGLVTSRLGPAPVVGCSPASGSAFVIGDTTVTCRASDAAGNSSSAQFIVSVTDAEAPVISVGANQTIELASGITGMVEFVEPTATDNSGEVTVTCDPGRGTIMALGEQTISCEALDPSGNAAKTTFSVLVVGAPANTTQDTVPGIPVGGLPATGGGRSGLTAALIALALGSFLTLASRRRQGALHVAGG